MYYYLSISNIWTLASIFLDVVLFIVQLEKQVMRKSKIFIHRHPHCTPDHPSFLKRWWQAPVLWCIDLAVLFKGLTFQKPDSEMIIRLELRSEQLANPLPLHSSLRGTQGRINVKLAGWPPSHLSSSVASASLCLDLSIRWMRSSQYDLRVCSKRSMKYSRRGER